MDFDEYRAEIERHLRQAPEGMPDNCIVLPRVDSTSRMARRCVEEYHKEFEAVPGICVMSLTQSAGRGRNGRTWESPAGQGVYATVVSSVKERRSLQNLPLAVATAMANALGDILSCPCRLKWPNDLMAEGGKIGGILIEAISGPEGKTETLIGFGVNLSSAPLPTATCVADHCTEPPSMGALAVALAAAAARGARNLADDERVVADYASLSIHRPGDRLVCRFGDRRVVGSFLGFEAGGHLHLDCAGESELLAAGEIVEYLESPEEGE